MIHQLYFEESQRAKLFDSPLYRGFGLYPDVNPDIRRNCPELENPIHLPLLSEFAAMLHLWRNPELDSDPWIGFTSYRQLEKGYPTCLDDRQALEAALAQRDIVGWGFLEFFDHLSGQPLSLAEQAERCHPGINSCLWRLLMMRTEAIPTNYLIGNSGLYGNYWVMSKVNFNEFMRWSYPLMRWCLINPDDYVKSHPRSLAYLIERLFICWYGLRRKRPLNVGTVRRIVCGNPFYNPDVVEQPALAEAAAQLHAWNVSLLELCQRHRAMPRGIIHVGAHYAEEREAYRQLGVSRVLWIEADPEHMTQLQAHIAGYPGSRALQACLADVDGRETTFYRTDNRGESSSILPMGLHREMFKDIHVVGQTQLPTTTFARLVEREKIDLEQYDFLVMDVQGAELLALKGFGDYLQRFNGVYIEVNLAHLYEGCALLPEIDAYLKAYGLTRRELLLTTRNYGDALYLRAGAYLEPPPDLVGRAQRAREQVLRTRSFTYHCAGQGARVMELVDEGIIAEGHSQLEQVWITRCCGHEVLLEMAGNHGRSCCLRYQANGGWRGHSVLFPDMPIELSPRIGAPAGAPLPSLPEARLPYPFGSNIPAGLVESLRDTFHLNCFIETGTYQGLTAKLMASRFQKIYTIELEPGIFRNTRAQLASFENIRCLLGDTTQQLPNILREVGGPALFWLDAHWSGGATGKGETECPLLKELAIIYAHRPDHVVLIDDARLFLAPPPAPHRAGDWPTLQEISEFLGKQRPVPYVRIVGDVIVAGPPQAAAVVEEYCRKPALPADKSHGDPGDQRRPNHWLNSFARRYSAQLGEDGILERILEVISENDKWCVEFGACDGVTNSNTHHFIMRKGYAAVLIEAEPARFQALKRTYQNCERVMPLNQWVGFQGENVLDRLLAPTPVPVHFDLLSIDIDGNDYHVWEAVSSYRPKIVVIEYNPTIPDDVEFVQAKDMDVRQGSSLLSLCRLAKRKGYELVAATSINALFVDSRYYPLFGIQDNSLAQLRTDRSAITHLFHGFDGTVFLRGAKKLVWHDFPLDESGWQPLPKSLRKYPECYDQAEQGLFLSYKTQYQRLLREDPAAARAFLNQSD